MCPACVAAAAIAAAKLASAGGLAAYGIKKLLMTAEPAALVPHPRPLECENETAEDRVPR